MNTMFYRIGQRAEVYAFIPLVDDAATDLAEQAAADFWKRTGIANSIRPLKITLLDGRGQHYGTFDVAVAQAPIYRATLSSPTRRTILQEADVQNAELTMGSTTAPLPYPLVSLQRIKGIHTHTLPK